jgi:hypothetical protein
LREHRVSKPARKWCLALLLLGLALRDHALADDSAITADQIAERVVRPDALNWSGGRTRVRMALTGPDGTRREHSLEITGRRKDGHYQSVVRFLNPVDVAGTAFLLLEHGQDESEQYLYLPSIQRTRRIVGRERDGSFMGTDFTYADMQGVDAKHARHKRLPDENLGSEACYVIESTLDASSKLVYGKIATWARQSDYIALRTKFYDRAGALVKTLYSRRVKNMDGKTVVVEARMQNERVVHATEIFVDAVERRDDFADAQFTPSALEHP